MTQQHTEPGAGVQDPEPSTHPSGEPHPDPEPKPAADPAPSPAGDSSAKGKGPEPKTFDEDYVKRLRDEAASRRTAAKELEGKLADAEKRQQQQMDAIAKALGLKEDDTPPDPAELTQKLTASQEKARLGEVKLAVFTAAAASEARADRLLDSVSFMNAIKGLDPTDADFSAQVSKAITDQVEADDYFKAEAPKAPTPAKPPTRSGGDFNSPGGTKPITRDQLAKMSPAEIEKAHSEGRLDHLL